jgi:acetylornithine deacetylase/succinyl-diaminopimelate desuccinylase-like protein
MDRQGAVSRAWSYVDKGGFFEDLARRVAIPTESQNPERETEIRNYLCQEMGPYLEAMGFQWEILENKAVPRLPFLVAQRMESPSRPTVLTYGHGDTVRGMEGKWTKNRSPWRLLQDGQKLYGRGTADNKGQHTINLAAMGCVLEERGHLGFNVKVLLETAEEIGSPGLHRFCIEHRDLLAADALIASDGPRLKPTRATVYGGSRGVFNFDLEVNLRQGAHHSGNWGGLLSNPGIILAHAIASMVNSRGKILVQELVPKDIPEWVRQSLACLEVEGEEGPSIDPDWGEPGLSLAEKVYGWSSLEVLAFQTGDPSAPAHAIPPRAWARCHLRFVAGQDPSSFLPAIRRHLDSHGFQQVHVEPVRESWTNATRMSPKEPWVMRTMSSLQKTSGQQPDFLPNLGGTLPNDAFKEILGLPTVWIPHSYGGCSQHAPDEHLLLPLARDAMGLMAGLFWDLGEEAWELGL